MSHAAQQWAYAQPLPSPEKPVLTTLAWHANGQDGRCHPSDATLARETGFRRETVVRARLRLRALGLIDWKRGGRERPNRYVLHLDRSAAESHHERDVVTDDVTESRDVVTDSHSRSDRESHELEENRKELRAERTAVEAQNASTAARWPSASELLREVDF